MKLGVLQKNNCQHIICRIDANFVIKVADFGLSENVYSRNYFREGDKEGVKLPVKWMAIESLHDGIFTEKTDVVSRVVLASAVPHYTQVWKPPF